MEMNQDIKKKHIRLPIDIPLIIRVFILLCYYKILIRTRPVEAIINPPVKARQNEAGSPKKRPSQFQTNMDKQLYKRWYVCHILQHMVFRDAKPCLARSILLFKWCQENRVQASIVIGVKKSSTKLEGHSWIVFNNYPLNENESFLKDYTIMVQQNALSRT